MEALEFGVIAWYALNLNAEIFSCVILSISKKTTQYTLEDGFLNGPGYWNKLLLIIEYELYKRDSNFKNHIM